MSAGKGTQRSPVSGHQTAHAILISVTWIALVGASLVWNWQETGRLITAMAMTEARASLEKDLLYRRWGAMHGGVYVPPTETTPPNPYLAFRPDRDVVTTTGKRLTLVNPAYMTRQVFALAKETTGTWGHITSLRPLRPENSPDPWEAEALRRFEAGAREISKLQEIDGEPYLRLMRPLRAERSCLTCHAPQGYREGDIRGGLSVSIPFAPYAAAIRGRRQDLVLLHLLLGGLGLAGLLFGHVRLLRTTRALREHKDRLLTLINATPDIICFKDGKGRWLEANRADLELFCLTDVDYRGRTDAELAEYTHEVFRPAFLACEESDELAWRAGHISRTEEVIARPDGTERVYDVIKVPVFEEDGTRKGLIVLGRDITEQRRLQEERARLQDRLQQAQRLESIGRLAGGVAHDLNNLLTPIIGYGELLLQELEPGDPRAGHVRQVLHAATRAREIVRQLLAFSRKQIMEMRPVDLNGVVAGLQGLLRRTIRENVEIVLDLARDLPPIRGDVGQLEQVIVNLAVNAHDAMPDGGRLTIRTMVIEVGEGHPACVHGAAPGRHVVLEVEDTGCGMDEETRARIFEPFFTTKNKDRGTGLGLSTVHGIVGQHGGTVTVDSSPGAGTRFRVYLPVLADGDRPGAEAPPSAPAAGARGSETILLVEDDEMVRELAITILRTCGYRVIAAADGDEALALLERHGDEVRLLLTDVIMPGMTGKELFTRARRLRPDLRVVYMSGYPQDVIAHRGVLDEGTTFLPKPFTVEELATRIRRALDG